MRVGRFLLSRIRNAGSILAVGFLLRLVDLGLRLTTYRRISQLLLRLSPTPDPELVDPKRAIYLARKVNQTAYRFPFKATCLRRSLVLWWLLRWFGIPSQIRFGMNLKDGHAWVEHHQRVVNDAANIRTRYTFSYADELSPETMSQLQSLLDRHEL